MFDLGSVWKTRRGVYSLLSYALVIGEQNNTVYFINLDARHVWYKINHCIITMDVKLFCNGYEFVELNDRYQKFISNKFLEENDILEIFKQSRII